MSRQFHAGIDSTAIIKTVIERTSTHHAAFMDKILVAHFNTQQLQIPQQSNKQPNSENR